MATSLFQSQSPPMVETVAVEDLPTPGPNAVEVFSAQYDPDQGLVVVSMPGDVQAVFKLPEMPNEGSSFTTLLQDNKLGPKIEVRVIPRTPMPKFATPEEADAWLEANA